MSVSDEQIERIVSRTCDYDFMDKPLATDLKELRAAVRRLSNDDFEVEGACPHFVNAYNDLMVLVGLSLWSGEPSQ